MALTWATDVAWLVVVAAPLPAAPLPAAPLPAAPLPAAPLPAAVVLAGLGAGLWWRRCLVPLPPPAGAEVVGLAVAPPPVAPPPAGGLVAGAVVAGGVVAAAAVIGPLTVTSIARPALVRCRFVPTGKTSDSAEFASAAAAASWTTMQVTDELPPP